LAEAVFFWGKVMDANQAQSAGQFPESLDRKANFPPGTIELASAKMCTAQQPQAVITNYLNLLQKVLNGDTGIIHENEIEPVEAIDTLQSIGAQPNLSSLGEQALGQLAVIRLNGGLGSSMGMPTAKSLLPVRGTLTFNDLMIRQLECLQRETGHNVPLIHMTSFRTDEDIKLVMQQAAYCNPEDLPVTFRQHQHLKIYLDDLSPAQESRDDLNWNPPGHGDIYAALLATGIAQKLIDAGKRWLFVANSDNLGATVAPEILGYMIHYRCPFLMETCRRTEADKKGGHLAKNKSNDRLILREVAQAPTIEGEVIPEFGNIGRYHQFNTNSIWLDLQSVVKIAALHDGCIPLPLIRNIKPVDTEDPSSRKVIQIETAMGAAIESFPGARALEVPRGRFMPVKHNSDLLLVRSDWFRENADGTISQHESTGGAPPPTISLDPRFFSMFGDFSSRVLHPPSLVHAKSLKVIGNWQFKEPVIIRGHVVLETQNQERGQTPDLVTQELVDKANRN
jgi:UTP--glucose-1-phosphate uridylyltransferase